MTRLPHNRQTLLVTAAAIAAIGLATLLSPSTRSPSGWYVFSGLFLMLAIVSEFSPDSGALKVLLIIFVSASTAFGLAGRLSGRDLQRASLVIIAMALLESVIAAIEPFAFPTHLWVPAQTDPITGFIVPLHNGLLGGERSQGTFGHPLPLGVLLALGVGLVVRQAGIALAHRVWIIAILLVGLAFADDQNSTLMVAVLLLFFSTRRVSGVRVLFGVAAAGSAVLAAIATSILTSAKVHDFYASGSYTHRVGAYDSIPKLLFQQPFHAVLFGNGTGSTERIFSEGLLQTDGLQAIDNQFVALLSQGGLVAATLLAVLCVLAVIVCPGPLRPALLVVVATLFVFDSFLWPSASALTATVLGAALSRQVVPRFGRTARAVGARPGESTG